MTPPPLYVRRPFLAGLLRQLPLLAVLVVVAVAAGVLGRDRSPEPAYDEA